jgi:hypothetical protein
MNSRIIFVLPLAVFSQKALMIKNSCSGILIFNCLKSFRDLDTILQIAWQ